jgi:hypothetical protein
MNMPWSAVAGAVASGVIGSVLSDGSSGGSSGGGGGVDPGQTRLNNANADAAIFNLDRYKAKFVPVEDQFLADASQAGTPAQIESKMGMAHGDAMQAAALASKGIAETTRRRGVSMNSPAALALQQDAVLAGAALDATSQTSAREAEINRGLALKQAAIGIGRGLDSTAATLGGAATSGFSSAANAASLGYRNNLTERSLQQQGVAPIAKAVGTGVSNWAKSGFGPSSGVSYGGYTPANGGSGGYGGSQWSDGADDYGANYDSLAGWGADGGVINLARRGIRRYSSGGIVEGPGGPTDDAVPAMVDGQQPIAVSDGEAVINEAATSRVLGSRLVNVINALGVLRRTVEGPGADNSLRPMAAGVMG